MAGRPTKYDPVYAKIARKCAMRGMTRAEIAEVLQICRDTLYRWTLAYRPFSDALNAGTSVADDRVERCLYERAVGYSFESEKIFCSKDGLVTRVATTEHVPPDVTAQIFWLKNRRREEWRDKIEHDVTGDVMYSFDDPTQRPAGYERKPPAPTAH
jgi:hypothetical protein